MAKKQGNIALKKCCLVKLYKTEIVGKKYLPTIWDAQDFLQINIWCSNDVSAATSGEIIENDKEYHRTSSLSLHNDVDIKMGIIYKKCKNIQKLLLFV